MNTTSTVNIKYKTMACRRQGSPSIIVVHCDVTVTHRAPTATAVPNDSHSVRNHNSYFKWSFEETFYDFQSLSDLNTLYK